MKQLRPSVAKKSTIKKKEKRNISKRKDRTVEITQLE